MKYFLEIKKCLLLKTSEGKIDLSGSNVWEVVSTYGALVRLVKCEEMPAEAEKGG